ncbi:MAG: hypothetical protein Q9P90_17340 [candidate division KSB1 bacterium]|nr:hypothetical protein [candidate division KSB1 bacterium]
MKRQKQAGQWIAPVILILLMWSFPGTASLQPADSLLAHYPVRMGNAWDYYGDVPFLGVPTYPAWHLYSAVGDSLHANGHRYTVIELIQYEMAGQSRPGALGTIRRRTILQRVDSTRLTIYRIDPWVRPMNEVLYDSLLAQAGDTLWSSPGALLLIDVRQRELFGTTRWVRKLATTQSLVFSSFETAEGLGMWSYSGGEPVGPAFVLQGAVIDGDTLGLPLRYRRPQLLALPGRLLFSKEQTEQTVVFQNTGQGLAIIDSLAMQYEERFYSQPYYHGLGYAHTFFTRGPYLVFPQDSIHLKLFIREPMLASGFSDTVQVFSRDVRGRRLPVIRIPVRVDPVSGMKRHPAAERVTPADYALRVFPNPARLPSRVFVTFRLARPEAVRLSVLDILGRTVMEKSWPWLPAGSHRFVIPIGEWGTGAYFIRMRGARREAVVKWRVVR